MSLLKVKKIEGILLFDGSTGSSPVTATDSLVRLADDKSGVSYHGANAISNIPSTGVSPVDGSACSSPVTATGSLMRLTDDKSGVSYQGANAIGNTPSLKNISQSANEGKAENLNWIEQNKFTYDENKSVEENMAAAEKIAQEYLNIFCITLISITPEQIKLRRKIIKELYGNGDNVVLPIVGSYESDVQEKMDNLQKAGYEVNLYHVALPLEKILERTQNRFKETGRLVSTNYIKSVGNKTKNNYDKLKTSKEIDSYCEWDNNVKRGEVPRLIEKGGNENGEGLDKENDIRRGTGLLGRSELSDTETESRLVRRERSSQLVNGERGKKTVSETKVERRKGEKVERAVNAEKSVKNSQTGDGSTATDNLVDNRNLTDQHKLLQQLDNEIGVNVVFFSNYNRDFHGAYKNDTIYLNVNSARSLTTTFAHELFHFLKANNPKLFSKMAKAADITESQLANYLTETKRTDVTENADVTEEMIADAMQQILSRVAKKDKSLVQRFLAWLKDTFQKFKDFFQNPKGKLTR